MVTTYSKHKNEPFQGRISCETCKKGTETGEEGACVPRFGQFGEQQFGFRVVFIGPQVFKTKDANDSEGLGYGLLVPAGLWTMCWSLCPYESVTPNACSWRSVDNVDERLEFQVEVEVFQGLNIAKYAVLRCSN